jgi:hypothetical protein
MEIRARAFAVLIIKDAINLIDVISEFQFNAAEKTKDRHLRQPSFTTTFCALRKSWLAMNSVRVCKKSLNHASFE